MDPDEACEMGLNKNLTLLSSCKVEKEKHIACKVECRLLQKEIDQCNKRVTENNVL